MRQDDDDFGRGRVSWNRAKGEVEVLGQNITKMGGTKKVRFRGDNIGFVFQQYNLLPSLTAQENACIPLC